LKLGKKWFTSFDDRSSLALATLASLDDVDVLGGEFMDPSCIDKKYFVAACRSCSRSSAVCRLKTNLKLNLFYFV
jgi:hypothetical protein